MIIKSLFLIFLAISTLNASEFYSSNELMQKKSQIEAISGNGWELEISDNEESLFLDGSLHSSKTYHNDGYEIVRPESKERIFLNDDGLIERKIITTGDGSEEYNYFYTDGVLSSYNLSVNSEVERVVNYVTSREGRLLSFESGEMRYLSPEFFVYTFDGSSVRLASEEEVEAESEMLPLEDGGYKRTVGETTFTYSPEGRLILEESLDKAIFYTYGEDGSLRERKSDIGLNSEIEVYSNGVLEKTVYLESGVIVRELYPLDSGESYELRFMDGKAQYKILYDKDGKRVKEIVKL